MSFFSPSGFEIQSDYDYKISILNQSLKRLSEREKSDSWPGIHCRETATISKFSALIFETYFSSIWQQFGV